MNDTVRMDVDGEHTEYGPFRISIDMPVSYLKPNVRVEFVELVHQMLLPGSGTENLGTETPFQEAMIQLGFKDLNWDKSLRIE